MKRILVMLCAVALVFNSNAQSGCLNSQDANGDGLIGVDDLMDLLSHWGDTDFDFDGVYDSVDLCTDEEACNYVLKPTEPCEYLDALGVCGGGCPLDLDGDGVCDEVFGACQGLDSFTFDGYAYDLVAIGDQCWFAENLRTEHYANGDLIPGELSDSEWSTTTNGAMTVYGEGTSTVHHGSNDAGSNLEDYGRLYNWYAVEDDRGLCPSGWHVPTDEEWMELEMELGMSNEEANEEQWRGDDQGIQLKNSIEGAPSWDGTNVSGFSALAGGYRYHPGYFASQGIQGYFWTSTPWGTSQDAFFRQLRTGYSGVYRYSDFHKRAGASVRCLKDTE